MQTGASESDRYHYPPDLLQLLGDTIPLLGRSKQQVLTFFRACGVPSSLFADLQSQLDTNRDSINWFFMARTILVRLNEGGDHWLAARREVVRRVAEFEDFGLCWPDKQLQVKGLVADVRRNVEIKDAFTRMQQERDRERAVHLRQRAHEAESRRSRVLHQEELRTHLAATLRIDDGVRRGIALEHVTTEIFKFGGVLIREPFVRRSEEGSPEEQIDGIVQIDGEYYLVEVKGWRAPLDVNPVSRHLVRVYGRGNASGFLISLSGYTRAAVEECRRALNTKTIVLAEARELVLVLERDGDIQRWMRTKIEAAIGDLNPLHFPSV